MKYRFALFFLFIVSLCTFQFVRAEEPSLPLFGKVIYLDPGHGGADPGAMYQGIKEAPLNLKIAELLQADLEKKGAIVYLTRYGDYDLSVPHAINRKRSDLSRRGNIINRSDCDLYLSIHLNADPTSSNGYGAQVFFDDVNPKNEELAKIMQEEFKNNLHTPRSYRETSEMYLHRRIERPGVLIEVGFLSNANERWLLQQSDYQAKVIYTISKGILRFFDKN